MCFLLRWNQNIDIHVRGLSKKYDGLFVGSRLEDEIEKMGRWQNRNAPPHPEWSSSSDVADTGEIFGIIDAQIRRDIENSVGVETPPKQRKRQWMN